MKYGIMSGDFWQHITEGFGCAWAVTCDAHRATLYDSEEEALMWAKLAHVSRPHVVSRDGTSEAA